MAAVSADEAKAAGLHAHAGRRREGRQQGRHHPRLERRRSTPPAGFKTGDGIRPDPFAGEKPRL